MSSIRILVLGSGMVAPPCVQYLLRNEQNNITVGEYSLVQLSDSVLANFHSFQLAAVCRPQKRLSPGCPE